MTVLEPRAAFDGSVPIRIAFDMFVLGQGIKTGVYRVCDALYPMLAACPEFAPAAILRDAEFSKPARQYLAEHELQWPWLAADAVSKADVLFLPFLGPWEPWTQDTGVVKAFIAYDIIAILQPDCFDEPLANLVKRIYDTLPRDAIVFCISENTRRDVQRYRPDIPTANLVTIPLAAGPSFTPCADAAAVLAVRRQYGIPDGADYVLSVATLEKRKNLHTTVAGFARYRQLHPDANVYLVLAGMKGWKLEALKRELARLGKDVRSRVVMTGFVREEHLAALYSGAKVFVYMSLYEGFGLPPLEAMACGTPVITSNTSSLPEVVGDAGIMLPPDDSVGLAEALASLLHVDALRRDMGRRCLMQAQKYSWEKCANIVIETIKSAVSARPKLSIITICYNEAHMEDTCRSVAAQTWRDFEWIVMDGGSTDPQCRAVLERYRSAMTHFVSESDDGRYDAMNKGIQRARGQYLLFLNGGDYLAHERVLERIFAYKPIPGLETYTDLHFDADIMHGEVLCKETGMMPWPIWSVGPQKLDREYFAGHSLPHQATFIRRGLFQQIGLYDLAYKYAADYEWFMRALLLHGASSCYIPMPVSVYNFAGVSSSSTEADAPHIMEAQRAYRECLEKMRLPIPAETPPLLPRIKAFVKRVAPAWFVKWVREVRAGNGG